jgi:outer membrane receptor protein involved in Fe transport
LPATPPAQQFYVLAENPTTAAVGALGLTNLSYYGQTTYSVFANLTYHFNDRFDLQVGARRDWIDSYDSVAFFSGPLTGAPPSTSVLPVGELRNNTYLITPRLRLSPDVMLYARLATGYIPGGFNVGTGVPPTFGPETAKNYEIGSKAAFLDHRLSLDASLYYLDFSEIQNGFYNSTTKASYTANTGKATSKGVELSVEALPRTGMKVAAWVVLSDAKLTTIDPGTILPQGIGVGDPLPNSSRFSANLSMDQSFPLSNAITGTVGATLGYIGERQGPYATPRPIFPPFAWTNLRAGVRHDAWTASLYVNNLMDRRGVISGDLQLFIPYSTYYIQPRTFGVNVARTF